LPELAAVGDVIERARESRLRYFGHVVRRGEKEPIRRAKNMPVIGRRSVGCQHIRWMDVVGKDIVEVGLEEGDARDRN
ncbi:hypothetical protein SK128_008851, partial [Halocaridina rubra]